MTKINSRVLAGAAIAGAALMGVTGLTAGSAEAGKLPGINKTKDLAGNGTVTIRLTDEFARISKPVTNVPTSREVLLSGKVRVTTSGEVKGGNISVGYLVGCQVNFGAGAGLEGGQDFAISDQGVTTSGDPSGEVSGGVTLSPGEAGYVSVINASVGGDSVTSFDFGNATGGVAYSQERFGVDGCAGYAEAMAKVTVKVSTDTFKGNVTAYGKPFSIG